MDKPDMGALVRQVAQEMIAGTRVEMVGPQDGEVLLWLLAQYEEEVARLDALEERWDALLERQAATIAALLEENDTLRAQLFVQDRKAPGP